VTTPVAADQGNTSSSEAPDLDGQLVAALDVVLPRVNRALRHALNRTEGDARLTITQFHCLRAIAASPSPAKTTHLARQLQVTAPTMTRTIDSMVERGLVARQADPADRRTVGLVLTEAGEELRRRYQAAIDDRLRELVSFLSPAQKKRLLTGTADLTAMLDAAERRERDAS
jgi:DNA-binding MarR family transcriptional regulator